MLNHSYNFQGMLETGEKVNTASQMQELQKENAKLKTDLDDVAKELYDARDKNQVRGIFSST